MMKMEKQIVRLLLKAIAVFACVGLCVNFMPSIASRLTGIYTAAAVLSSPDTIADGVQSKLSAYIPKEEEHTTTAPGVEQPREVMKPIGSKDSDDDWSITETPSDILSLMKEAEDTVSSSDYVGKTSEEPYLGGGTVLSYNGVEVQSKIPSDFYEPNIEELLGIGADLKIRDKSKPVILVYHSHTTEAYALLDSGYYISSDARSKDSARNVVRVGDELVKALEQQGFSVIHDTEIHDEDYNSSYDNSRESVEKYLEEYPSIEITIDLHRDDITYKDKTKVKPTAVINGKKAAKMMIISGCEYGLVKNYPDWEYNLRFDLAVQQKVNALYEGVMRPVLFSQRKYNMYETHNSFLLEVGTDANTLEEACYSARMFGDALGKLLNETYAVAE